jgi:hypothetical protein
MLESNFRANNHGLMPSPLNDENNFICLWDLAPTTHQMTLLDRINEWFESEAECSPGTVGGNAEVPAIKQSIDACFTQNMPLLQEYVSDILDPVLNLYLAKYPWANDVAPFHAQARMNIQEYKPASNGYMGWHMERDCPANLTRHLVFMTYLNDVTDGGETQFYHQNLSITPKKGRTVIFPPDWQFVHRGLPSPTQTKRFITGWFVFDSEEDSPPRENASDLQYDEKTGIPLE